MRKSSGAGGNGLSRVRFIMLDAELNDGDLSQVTQAIQNALRPTTPTTPRVLVQRMAPANVDAAEVQPVETETDEAEVDQGQQQTQPRPSSPRKFRTPKVLAVDLTSEPSFAVFAQAKNPSSDLMRFLVVAAWFKLERNVEEITADHVYTCYRMVKWQSDIADFNQPLRDLKRRQLLEKRPNGGYTINHLGLAEVDKMGAA